MATKSFTTTAAALAALTDLVAAAKEADPFARVTVLVPSHASGLDVSRHLARTLGSGSCSGVVAVDTFTVEDLAESLFEATGAGHGRQKLPLAIRQGAIAAALKEEPGLFRGVWDQPATAAAIAATSQFMDHVELEAAGSPPLPALVAEVWKLHLTAAHALSARYYTLSEALAGAAAAVVAPDNAERLGVVASFLLPEPGTAQAARFTARLQALPGYTAFTARAAVDDSATVLTASDSDDETRAAVRMVTELVAGTTASPPVPAHRVGIFYTSADPYRSLLARRLEEACITFNGPDPTQLADMPIARGLQTLLRLNPTDLDLRPVLNVLAEGALHWSGNLLPSATTCERLYLNPFVEDVDTDPDMEESENVARRRTNAAQFDAFRDELASRLAALHASNSWSVAAELLAGIILSFFGPRSDQELPQVTHSRDALLNIIAGFPALDGVAPPPHPSIIASVLESEIASDQARRGKIGRGVTVGTLHDGVGRDLDVVLVLGLAEGLAPAKVLEDPLLPDTVKHDFNTGLPGTEQRAEAQNAQFGVLLGTAVRTVLFAPRGNLRGSGSYELSRWITSAVSKEFELEILASFDQSVRTGAGTQDGLAPTIQEWGIRRALAAPGGVSSVADASLATALEIRLDRQQGRFSRFNGNLSGYPGNVVDVSRPLSPSSLEDWAGNPFGYFLKRVLHVNLFEDLDLELQIGAAQRGEMMHSALENFVQSVLVGAPATSETLDAVIAAAFSEGANPAWLPHLWERDRATMRQVLHGVLAADQESMAEGWDYLAPEAGFGPAEYGAAYGYPPVELELADGTTLAFLGKVDRVDKNTDGRVRIIDYKSGGNSRYKAIKQEDPTAGGTKFQLPVYGLFAEQFRDNADVPVQAEYWFIGGGDTFVGYEVDGTVLETFRDDVGLVLKGMTNGVFPHIPETAPFTTYTGVAGTGSVARTWARLRSDRTIREFSMLVEATHGK